MRKGLNNISVTMLSVLEALYLTGKTTRAAERLNLTQPSISVYLKQLRALTGDALFIRNPRGLEPTAFCHHYYPQVSKILDDLQGLTILQNQVFNPDKMAAEYSIVVPFVKGRMLFEELCLGVINKFPSVKANMINIAEHQALQHVEEGLTDIYIGMVSEKLEKHFLSQKILKTELVVLCSENNPHFKKGSIGRTEYLSTPHIKATASFEPSILDTKFKREGLLQENLIVVPDIWAEVEMLRSTDYLLLIDRHDIGFINDNSSLKVLKTDFQIPQFDLYAVWHARNEADPAHKWYRNFIFDICQKYNSGVKRK